MAATFKVIALSSLDPGGEDTRNEPHLAYPEAITAASELKFQGKAFRVIPDSELDEAQRQAFADLGALF